ncbi:MAG TPA: DUF6584 family protein [Thermoanaerobaculia bacterium]|nr:DUF6584 family protein [Thermoanaerobaculia bacterium]
MTGLPPLHAVALAAAVSIAAVLGGPGFAGARQPADDGGRAAERVRAALGAGELDVARRAITEERLRRPESSALVLAEVEVRVAVGDLEGARRLMASVAGIAAPESGRRAAGLAVALDTDVAVLGARLAEAPGDPWALLGLALARLEAGDGEAALAPLRMALDSAPRLELPRALLLQLAPNSVPPPPADSMDPTTLDRAAAELAAGRGGVDAVLAGLRERPFYLPAHRALIAAAERESDVWRALRGRRQLRRWLGAVPRFDLDSARAALGIEAWDLAACLLDAARGVAGDTPRSLELASRVAAGREAPGEALALAREAASAAAPHGPGVELLLWIGELEYRRMDVDGAVAALARAIEEQPGQAERVASFALSVALAERLGAVRTRLEERLAEHPESVNVAYALALVDLREGRLERARDRLRGLVSRLPEESQVHYNLGLVERRLGDLEAARRAFDRFRELEEAERQRWEQRNAADRRRRDAQDAAGAGRPRDAVALYREIVDSGLASADDLVALARAHLALDEAAAADALLERASALRPAHREALRGRLEIAAARSPDDPVARAMAERLELLDPASWGCEPGSR